MRLERDQHLAHTSEMPSDLRRLTWAHISSEPVRDRTPPSRWLAVDHNGLAVLGQGHELPVPRPLRSERGDEPGPVGERVGEAVQLDLPVGLAIVTDPSPIIGRGSHHLRLATIDGTKSHDPAVGMTSRRTDHRR